MPRWRLGLLVAVLAGAAAQDVQDSPADDDESSALAEMKDDFKGMAKERIYMKALDKKYHHLIGELKKDATDAYQKQVEEHDFNLQKTGDTNKEIGEVDTDTDTDSASSFLETAPTPLPVDEAEEAMRNFLTTMQHRKEHYREDRKEREATIEKDAKAREEKQQQMALQQQQDAAKAVGIAAHPSSFLEEDGWDTSALSRWHEYEAAMDSLDSKFKREAFRYDNMAKSAAMEQAAVERTAIEPSSLIQTGSNEPDDSQALERTGYMDLRRVNDQLSKLQQRMKTEAAEAERETAGIEAKDPQPDTPAQTEDGAVGDADPSSFLEWPRHLNKMEMGDLNHFQSAMEAVRQSFHKSEDEVIARDRAEKREALEEKFPRLDTEEDDEELLKSEEATLPEHHHSSGTNLILDMGRAAEKAERKYSAILKEKKGRNSSRRTRHNADAWRESESSFLEAEHPKETTHKATTHKKATHKKATHKAKGKHVVKKVNKKATVPARIKNSPDLKAFKAKVAEEKTAEIAVKAEEKKAEADEKKQQAMVIKAEAKRKEAERKADAAKPDEAVMEGLNTLRADRAKILEKAKKKMHKLEEKMRDFRRKLPKGPEELPKLKAFKEDWAKRVAKSRHQREALHGLPSGSSMLQLAQDATEELDVVQRKVQARRAQRERQLAAYFEKVRGPAAPSSFAEVGQPRMADPVSDDLLSSWAQNIHKTEINMQAQQEDFYKRLGFAGAAPSSLLEAGEKFTPPFDPSTLDDSAQDDFPNADAAGVAAFEDRYNSWAARDRAQASADAADSAEMSQQLGRAMDMGKLRAALGEEPSSWLQRRERSEQLRGAGAA